MDQQHEQASRWTRAPVAVLLAACLFLVLLLATTRPAVFFSGDGGLKYLLTRQINMGRPALTLDLEAPGWVESIWKKGFYPFQPPFIYEQAGKKIVSFPPYFQQLSAPFLQWFGWRGLYVLPAASLLLLWMAMSRLLYQLKIKPAWTAASLFCLTFCSPLTLYGALYWEHTLAWFLLFAAIIFLVRPGNRPSAAFMLGAVSGLSAWLRPEALLFCLLVFLLVVFNQLKQRTKVNSYFLAGLAFFVALFLVGNKILYGDWLGAHAYQLDSGLLTSKRFSQSLVLLTHLNGKFLLYFPLALVVYGGAFYLYRLKKPVPNQILQLLLLVACFSLIAPFFLPNGGGKQWGPRYFLLLVSPLVVAGGWMVNRLRIRHSFLLAGIVLVVVYSFFLNSFAAWKILHDDYAYRVQPCLQALQKDSSSILIVQNQFIAQEFAALFATKHLFLAENRSEYLSLQDHLLAVGQHQWVFLARDKPLLLAAVGSIDQASIVEAGDYFFVRCRADHIPAQGRGSNELIVK